MKSLTSDKENDQVLLKVSQLEDFTNMLSNPYTLQLFSKV